MDASDDENTVVPTFVNYLYPIFNDEEKAELAAHWAYSRQRVFLQDWRDTYSEVSSEFSDDSFSDDDSDDEVILFPEDWELLFPSSYE